MKKRAMTSDEREIQAPVATWMAATRAGDLDTVLGLMAEDVVFLVHGREPMVGKAAYAAAAPAGAPMRRAGYTLSVLRKERGRRLIARDANLLAPA